MEGKNVVACTSRQLKSSEKNDIELAIVHALATWRHLLFGRKMDVFTDNESSKYVFIKPNLNLRQIRRLEILTDYTVVVQYKPGKANVIADALSRKGDYNNIQVKEIHPDLCKFFRKHNLGLVPAEYLASFVVVPTIHDKISEDRSGSSLIERSRKVLKLQFPSVVAIQCIEMAPCSWSRVVVPREGDLREVILKEPHVSKLSIQPGSRKMCQDLKQTFGELV